MFSKKWLVVRNDKDGHPRAVTDTRFYTKRSAMDAATHLNQTFNSSEGIGGLLTALLGGVRVYYVATVKQLKTAQEQAVLKQVDEFLKDPSTGVRAVRPPRRENPVT